MRLSRGSSARSWRRNLRSVHSPRLISSNHWEIFTAFETRMRRRWLDRTLWSHYKPALSLNLLRGGAQVAQLVEHATENRSVGGSIPPLGTISTSAPPK